MELWRRIETVRKMICKQYDRIHGAVHAPCVTRKERNELYSVHYKKVIYKKMYYACTCITDAEIV